MRDVLNNIHLDPRNRNAILSLVESAEIDYSLTIVQKGLNFQSYGNEIEGFRNYFIYWEQNPDKPIILKTSIAVLYSDIVFSDNVEVVVTEFDVLRRFGLPTVFTKEMGNDRHWKQLTDDMSGGNSIVATICELLQTSAYSEGLWRQWTSLDEYRRWLLWILARICAKSDYLQLVLNASSSVSEFEKELYMLIAQFADSPNYRDLYNQRKQLLLSIGLTPLNIWISDSSVDGGLLFKYLTDNSIEERMRILELAASVASWGTYLESLKDIYQTLWEYLQPCSIADTRIAEYFDLYKKCKVKDSLSDEFSKLVEEFAAEKCKSIWQLKSRNAIVKSQYTKDSAVFFVDALGVEYAGMIENLFDPELYDVVCEFGYCNLPSVTEENNDFYKNRNHIQPFTELDKWKHSNCTYPESIARELEVVCELKPIVDNALKTHSKVIIASDHGSSRMAVISKGESHHASVHAKKYRYGRYCFDETTDYSYIEGCIHYDGYWMFGNYDRFSQSGAPTYETHGGASIEEMIVPVICISRKIEIENKIEVLTPEIKLPVNKTVEIRFRSTMIMENVVVRVDGKTYQCLHENGIYFYEQHIENAKEIYLARVISNGAIVGEFEYVVSHPMGQHKKFDI